MVSLNHHLRHGREKISHRSIWTWLKMLLWLIPGALQWRHKERDGVSNHRHLDCLPNRLFRRSSKKTSKLRVTHLCEVNSPVIDEFPAQRVSNAENASIWWRHHGFILVFCGTGCHQPVTLHCRGIKCNAIIFLWVFFSSENSTRYSFMTQCPTDRQQT